ncbi:purine-cytosine permease family protein [Propionicicella superfundia]|uniref:purine-cytosine permease family protein n=1 Tax=Propionicicella superfundia TaxID=348582 RepID=UPI001B7FE26B|nr:cytosine permease [Propionicicella superfundia]
MGVADKVASESEGTPSPKKGIERRSIEMIPDSERHGTPWSQFTLWFGANLQITAIVDGALAVVFGADALWAILGLFIGQVIGGTVMALHSAQGPRLGLPQMISSRAQFGVYGATIPLVLVLMMYLGFASTGTVLSGQAINAAIGSDQRWIGIVIFAGITAVIAIFGYDVIHRLGRIASTVGMVGLGYVAIRLFQTNSFGGALANSQFELVPFMLAIALAAGWQLTYAPYAGDYSRYLPRDTPFGRAWLGPFAGSVLGATLSMTLGVFVAVAGGKAFLGNQVGFIGGLAHNQVLTVLVLITIVVGKLTVNTLNAYGGVMAISTALSGFTGKDTIPPKVRISFVIGFNLVVIGIALWASADFLTNFKNFILCLLLFFVPWSVINLINFYIVAKRNIDVPALYSVKGRYGKLHVPTVAVYFVGVLIQIPFMSQALFTGPLARMMGGIDLSWIVGLIGTAVLYYPISRNAFDYPSRMIYPEGMVVDRKDASIG